MENRSELIIPRLSLHRCLCDWYQNSHSRTLLITGSPGTGKTYISKWLIHGPSAENGRCRDHEIDALRRAIKAHHLCARGELTADPYIFAERLNRQLLESLPKFADYACARTPYVHVHGEVSIDRVDRSATVSAAGVNFHLNSLPVEAAFNALVREPLRHWAEDQPNESLVIVVDGLDEALGFDTYLNIPRQLGHLTDMPKNVRWLLTSRPDPRITRRFLEASHLDLDKTLPDTRDDLAALVRARLLEKSEYLDELIDRLYENSQGNFLYADRILQYMLQHKSRDEVSAVALGDKTLPPDLNKLYASFIESEVGDNEDYFDEVLGPLLGLVAVGHNEGLTQEHLEKLFGRELRSEFIKIGQFFVSDCPGGPFRLFHSSFADYLFAPKSYYRVDFQLMHRRLIDHFYPPSGVSWKGVDSYFRRAVLSHLLAVDDLIKIEDLVSSDWVFVRATSERLAPAAYRSDLNKLRSLLYRKMEKGKLENSRGIRLMLAVVSRIASLNDSLQALTPKLAGTLLEMKEWNVDDALAYCLSIEDPRRRGELLIAISPHLPEERLCWLFRLVISSIESASGKVTLIEQAASLGGRLPISQETENLQLLLVEAARQAPSKIISISLFTSIAERLQPVLASSVLDEALAELRRIELDSHEAEKIFREGLLSTKPASAGRAAAVGYFQVCHITKIAAAARGGELFRRAIDIGLDLAFGIPETIARTEALALLFPYLANDEKADIFQEVLNAIESINFGLFRSNCVTAMAPGLDCDLLEQILLFSLALQDAREKANAVASLLPVVAEGRRTMLVSEVIDTLALIDYEPAKVELVCQVVRYATVRDASRISNIVADLSDPKEKLRAICSIYPLVEVKDKSALLALGIESADAKEISPDLLRGLVSVMPSGLRELVSLGQEEATRNPSKVDLRAQLALVVGGECGTSLLREAVAIIDCNPPTLEFFDTISRIFTVVGSVPKIVVDQAISLADILEEDVRRIAFAKLACSLSGKQRKDLVRRARRSGDITLDRRLINALAPIYSNAERAKLIGKLSNMLQEMWGNEFGEWGLVNTIRAIILLAKDLNSPDKEEIIRQSCKHVQRLKSANDRCRLALLIAKSDLRGVVVGALERLPEDIAEVGGDDVVEFAACYGEFLDLLLERSRAGAPLEDTILAAVLPLGALFGIGRTCKHCQQNFRALTLLSGDAKFLEDRLDDVFSVDGNENLATALDRVASYAGVLPNESAFRVLMRALELCGPRGRACFQIVVRTLLPLIERFGGSEACEAVLEIILEDSLSSEAVLGFSKPMTCNSIAINKSLQ